MSLPTHLTLDIVTPERRSCARRSTRSQLPGTEGELGVLPGHTPLLTTLKVGALWYRKGDEKHFLSIAFGFAEVLPDRVTVLAQIAERAEEIDVSRGGTAQAAGRAAAREAGPGHEHDAGAGGVDQGQRPPACRLPGPDPLVTQPRGAASCDEPDRQLAGAAVCVDSRYAGSLGRDDASGHSPHVQRGQLLHAPGPRPVRRGRRHGRPRRR